VAGVFGVPGIGFSRVHSGFGWVEAPRMNYSQPNPNVNTQNERKFFNMSSCMWLISPLWFKTPTDVGGWAESLSQDSIAIDDYLSKGTPMELDIQDLITSSEDELKRAHGGLRPPAHRVGGQ